MIVLHRARAAQYDVGTNLKGRGLAATWTLLLPSLEVDTIAVAGRVSSGEREALERIAGRVTDLRSAAAELGGRPIDVIRAGRGADLARLAAGERSLAKRLAPTGAIYVEGRTTGTGRAALASLGGPVRRFGVWPAFGPPRVFVPNPTPETVERLAAIGVLPPRGTIDPLRGLLNRLTSGGPPRRWAALGLGPSAGFDGPPAYVAAIARDAGVDISTASWALIAPGDYASQKVLMPLFDPGSARPRTIVKLGADPTHADRLRNEAAALRHLATLDPPGGSVPELHFAGEHAGRGVVGQSWVAGRPFTRVPDRGDHTLLDAAVAWLEWLAIASVQRRAASEVGAAVRDLFERFDHVHRLPADETAALEAHVAAIERHAGSLPVVMQHGDPGIWNMLVADGVPALLDWESAEMLGMPLWDLVHLQFSYGAMVAARHEGVRRRLPAAIRHLVSPTDLQERFAGQLAAASASVGLPRSLIGPVVHTAWMYRALKEAPRRTSATLERGLYRRLLRELLRRSDEPAVRRLMGGDA